MTACTDLEVRSLISLQYSEAENANHHPNVSIADMASGSVFATPRSYPPNMRKVSSTTNVEVAQSATAQTQLAHRRELNQNSCTNSQYPKAPITEPVTRIASAYSWFVFS